MPDLPYRIVIGLEVHVQLLTRTKLFCGCSTQFGLPPNSATCPICIGMPGVLPVMNRRAFDLALKAALALNCRIAPFTKWDRKNYYYPDLPKNYQISQYDLPFSHDGWLEIETAAGSKRIGIIRVHLEEDAGKMLHDEKGGGRDSLVDLNRTGTPLLEIVSQPEMSTPEEAKAYLEEIRLLLRELEVSDCEMQEGSLRCDANVNIHIPQPASGGRKPPDGKDYVATPIVEVKNLNSFRAVERAMKYEAERQFEEYQKDGQEVRRGAEGDRRLGRSSRRHRRAAAQGGSVRLSLFPGAGPRAGRSGCALAGAYPRFARRATRGTTAAPARTARSLGLRRRGIDQPGPGRGCLFRRGGAPVATRRPPATGSATNCSPLSNSKAKPMSAPSRSRRLTWRN